MTTEEMLEEIQRLKAEMPPRTEIITTRLVPEDLYLRCELDGVIYALVNPLTWRRVEAAIPARKPDKTSVLYPRYTSIPVYEDEEKAAEILRNARAF